MTNYPIILAFILTGTLILADQRATTTDGRTVILKDDSTWTFVEETKTETTADVRGVNWGTDIATVKSIEQWEFVRGIDQLLLYKGHLAALEALLSYKFLEDKLMGLSYRFVEEYSNKNIYFNDFDEVNDLLKAKYGEPLKDNYIWSKDFYKNDASNYGKAVAAGHLQRRVAWKTPQTLIFHVLNRDDFGIAHMILYMSFEYGDLDEAKRKASSLDEL